MQENIYIVYSSDGDMSFIMRDCFDGEECKSTEVIGFYFGHPNEEATKEFVGKLKADFEM